VLGVLESASKVLGIVCLNEVEDMDIALLQATRGLINLVMVDELIVRLGHANGTPLLR